MTSQPIGRARASVSRSRSWLDGIDPVAAVRGGSRGFSLLVVGGMAYPVAVRVVPELGPVWLTITAAAAFAIAALRVGGATTPAVHGAAAAALSYLLVLPLVLMVPQARNVVQVLLTALTALVVGALTGFVAGRARRVAPQAGKGTRRPTDHGRRSK